MTNEEIAAALAQIAKRNDEIAATHTPENEARLQAEAASRGMKLLKSRRGVQGVALRDIKGNVVSGVTLADVDAVIRKVKPRTAET